MHAKIHHIIVIVLAILWPSAICAQINTEQMMRIGQNALYFEDYILSIQYFNQVIQAKPYLAQPYLMRAIAKINLDDYRGAEADATKAVELNPFLTDAWEVRGVARQNLGRNADAVADYDKALELLPRNRNIMFNKALAQNETDDFAGADTTFAALLQYYPNYDNGYLGRAKLRLAQADTVAASADIDRALEINPNAFNGYLMRAAIAIDQQKDYEQALADMNKALTLQPRLTGLYINRAFLRYQLNDYFGAMADYDYALEMEPFNTVALFNRSLLLMEVNDNDLAIKDLNNILKITPDDYRARFNRAVVNANKLDYDAAIADIGMVIDRFPEFSSAYYLRSEYYRNKNNLQKAKADYDIAESLTRRADQLSNSDSEIKTLPDDSPEEASKRFNTLLTIDQETDIDQEFNNSAIRGRIQDRDIQIELEPYMQLSYYSSPSELKQNGYYIKEVDDINATRMLRFVITIESRPPQLNDPELIQQHFSSIDYYNSYIATHTPRAIDYLGRALDMITVKNYDGAIADLDRALMLTPDNAVAYMLRAQAKFAKKDMPQDNGDDKMPRLSAANQLSLALADIDKAIDISPRNAIAWYDKGFILFEMGDYTSALAAFNKAIDLEPAMGEAYFNRGYVHLKLGDQKRGIDDLSKAGELGIASAYNLIKRISKTY